MISTLLFEFRAFVSVSVETGMINFNFAVRMINFNFAVRIPLNLTNHTQGDRKTETVIWLTGAAYVYQNTSQTKCTNGSIRHTSGISGGFRQLRIYDSAVMANFGTFVMRPKEDTARDKLIPRKLVRQSRGDTKDEDVICHHSAHCRQILSIKTPLSSPSNSRII